MNTTRNCIVVFIIPESGTMQSHEFALAQQRSALENFLEKNSSIRVLSTFTEKVRKQRNKNKWASFKQALKQAHDTNSDLIIPEIKQYHGLTVLGQILVSHFQSQDTQELYCLDQKYINKANIAEIINHLQERRKKHGELIKQGLKKTSNKSGNPKAAEVISKVNKPKILSSIVFSLIIEPIISHLEALKLPQRKMIEFLNQNQFVAPEGGRWVLSQFQKVYDRVRMNRTAFLLGNRLIDELERFEPEEIVQQLNYNESTPCPRGKEWNADLVLQTVERYKEIGEISRILNHIDDYLTILGDHDLNDLDIASLLDHPLLHKIHPVGKEQSDSYLKQA